MNQTAVLLDLDNTLYHYNPCNDAALKAVHVLLRRSMDVSFEHFTQLHDESRQQLAKRLAKQAASHNRLLFFKHIVDSLYKQPNPALILELHHGYWQAFFQTIKPHPDAHRVLDTLAGKYKLALVSNQVTQVQLEKLHHLDYAKYFTAIVTSEEAGVEKPDPRIFQTALGILGVEVDQTVMVGDHYRGDILGAQSLGLDTVFTTEFSKEDPVENKASHTIEQLGELLNIL